MYRRRLLGAVATVPGLSSSDSDPGDSDTEDRRGASRVPRNEPLDSCFGTVHLLFHDETIDVQVTTGERWTGCEYQPVADLRLRLDVGEITVTLSEADARALVAELDPALGEF